MNACSLSPQPTSECIVLCNSKNTGPAFSSNSKTQFRTQASAKIQITAYIPIVCVTPAFYAMLMQCSQDLHINGGHTRVAVNLWLQISRKFWPRERTLEFLRTRDEQILVNFEILPCHCNGIAKKERILSHSTSTRSTIIHFSSWTHFVCYSYSYSMEKTAHNLK